jgi:Mg-chelatase subunit ChlD
MRGVVAAVLAVVLVSGCPPSSSSSPPAPAAPAAVAPSSSPPAPAATAPVQSGVAIAIVFDTSGSMKGERLDAVKAAWKGTFAPKLAAYQKALDRLETVVVRCGGHDAEVISPLAHYDGGAVDGVVAGLSAGGGTPLGESLKLAYAQVVLSPRERKHIFVLTDGQANGSVAPRAVLQAMKDRGEKIKVWLVGFHSDRGFYKDFEDLGGKVLMADDAKGLEGACATIFDDILKPEAE